MIFHMHFVLWPKVPNFDRMEFTMLAEKDNAIDEAIVTLRVLTKDEEFKQRYLARLDYERVMRDQEIYAEGIKKENIELKNALADKDATIADKDAEITRLRALLNNQ